MSTTSIYMFDKLHHLLIDRPLDYVAACSAAARKGRGHVGRFWKKKEKRKRRKKEKKKRKRRKKKKEKRKEKEKKERKRKRYKAGYMATLVACG